MEMSRLLNAAILGHAAWLWLTFAAIVVVLLAIDLGMAKASFFRRVVILDVVCLPLARMLRDDKPRDILEQCTGAQQRLAGEVSLPHVTC
jgi:hypothetical protein